MSVLLFFLSLSGMFAGHPCAGAVARQLDAWDATEEVLRAPGGPLGGAVYRIATGRIGDWITVHQPRGLDSIVLFRTHQRGTIRLTFGPSCAPDPIQLADPPTARAGRRAFTDAELEARLAADDRLIVYFWSPHLPLSVEGYHELAHAAGELGIPFVAVVDASADAGLVAAEAEAAGIPHEATRPLGSVELLFRDLAVHTPSILVFAGDATAAPLPGYRHRNAYRLYLETLFRRLE